MPRVSPEHLEARRRHILDAARRCFVRNGFHATSMQDLFAEADVSAGAVYRYFPSKHDIVAALAADVFTHVRHAFESILDAEPLPRLDEALTQICVVLDRIDEDQDVAKMAIQLWGEAARSPELGKRVGELVGTIRALMARLVVTYQERGEISDDIPADEVAPTLMALFPGYLLQRVITGDLDADRMGLGLRGLLSSPRMA